MFTPFDNEIAIVPIAKLEAERSAIAASPLILLFLFSFRTRIDVMATIGVANQIGVKFSTVAIAKAPNAVCDKPSPSMEFLRRTNGTPTSAVQIEINNPAISARCIKVYESISKNQFICISLDIRL